MIYNFIIHTEWLNQMKSGKAFYGWLTTRLNSGIGSTTTEEGWSRVTNSGERNGNVEICNFIEHDQSLINSTEVNTFPNHVWPSEMIFVHFQSGVWLFLYELTRLGSSTRPGEGHVSFVCCWFQWLCVTLRFLLKKPRYDLLVILSMCLIPC